MWDEMMLLIGFYSEISMVLWEHQFQKNELSLPVQSSLQDNFLAIQLINES